MKKLSLIIASLVLALNITFAQSSKVSSAITYLSNGEIDRAKDAIDIAILNEKTVSEAKTWFQRGRVYNAIALDQTGKFSNLVTNPLDTALKSFKTALSMPDVKSFKKQILLELQYTQMGYFNLGSTAYSNQNFEGAFTAFSSSAEANNLQFDIDPAIPIDTGVIFNIGLTAEKTGKTDQAIATYQRLVDMQYGEAYVYGALVDLYMAAGREDKAIEVLNAGRKTYPKDESLLITELNFYISQGKVTDIVDKLKEAIAVDPDNMELYFALGNSYGELVKTVRIESGTPAASVKACLGEPLKQEVTATTGSGTAEIWAYEGLTFQIENGKVIDIEGKNELLLAMNTKCSNSELVGLYFREAVAAYTKAIELNPNSYEAALNLGALYYNTAIELNKKMILLPLDADVEYTRMEKERNDLYKASLPFFEKSHVLNATDVPTMQALKEIYAKTGDFTKMNEMKQLLGE